MFSGKVEKFLKTFWTLQINKKVQSSVIISKSTTDHVFAKKTILKNIKLLFNVYRRFFFDIFDRFFKNLCKFLVESNDLSAKHFSKALTILTFWLFSSVREVRQIRENSLQGVITLLKTCPRRNACKCVPDSWISVN